MAYQKKSTSGGIASIVKQAGAEARRNVLTSAISTASGKSQTSAQAARIFNILDYIEQPWGIGMHLFPVQRFIVKLAYFLPLEEHEKTITITDMFNTKELYHFTEVEYLRYLNDEGRCNLKEQDHERRDLVLACGRRGGKCVCGDSLVLTSTGLRQIEDLGDPNGPEYQPLNLTVIQEGQKEAQASYFYNGGVRDTVKVHSYCGYEVEGTPNHRVKVLAEDGTIQWRFLADVRVGDYLCVHRKTDMWATEDVNLAPLIVGLKHGRKKVDLPNRLNENWATLLGVLVGDGTWPRITALQVTVGPYPEWLIQVQELFRETLGEPKVALDRRSNRVSSVSYYSWTARDFFERLGFTSMAKSATKRVPWVIFRSSKLVVSAFLRGLFETDGCVEDMQRVTLSTASKNLAIDVQLLLLNFGVLCRFKSRWNKKYCRFYYHLELLGANSIRLFAEQIGFLSERKRGLLQAYLDKGKLKNSSDTESIPYQKEWCRKLVESVPKNGINLTGNLRDCPRSNLRAAFGNVIKNTKENFTYCRMSKVLDIARVESTDAGLIQHFEDLQETGYFFDPVSSVESGNCRVYDLVVPDGQMFTANGLVNHNTCLSGVFASYEVYRLLNLGNPQAYYGLPNGNRIQLISVATDQDQASLLYNEVTTHLAKCDYFKPYIANNTQKLVNFRTPYDIERYGPTSRMQDGKFVSFNGKATLRVTFKSCIAKGLRGAGNIVIILDEMAHFQDKGQGSAKDIYDAVTPSTAAFSPKDQKTGLPIFGRDTRTDSRVVCISSPLGRSGKFFELFDLAMRGGEGSENLIAIQAPTWEMNPTVPTSYYKQKYHEDPSVFMVEHGAQFSDQIRGWIERKEDLLQCVQADRRPVSSGLPRAPHQMGIDVGLVAGRDGTGVSITYADENKICLAYHELWRAGEDWLKTNPHLSEPLTPYARQLGSVERLDFDEIAIWIVELARRFYITDGLFDRWNGIPLEQALHKAGLRQFRSDFFTRDTTSKMYQTAKMLMYDNQLVLYDYPVIGHGEDRHSPLIKELLALQAHHLSKNLVLVEAPKIAGAHDDMSDALVRSIWLTHERLANQKFASHGTANYSPHVASPPSMHGYNVNRARRHGVVTSRMAPKNTSALSRFFR